MELKINRNDAPQESKYEQAFEKFDLSQTDEQVSAAVRQLVVPQALYKRHREAYRPHKRLEYAPLHSYIQICILESHWSPEEIVGRIQLEHGCRLVSIPTIYRAIRAGLLNLQRASAKFVLRKLQHHGKQRHKKGSEEHRDKFVISHPIENRPANAANRSIRGHRETDTVVGKQGKACLVMLMDQKSRYLLGGKAASKTAAAVNKAMCEHSRDSLIFRSHQIEGRNSRNMLRSARNRSV